MTLVVTVRRGERFTLWTVDSLVLTATGCVVTFEAGHNLPPRPIQGDIERIIRIG